jgi:ribonuclease P protein component, eubacterial
MEYTVSLKENHLFRRTYAKGKSAVMPSCVVYMRRNGRKENRLGITAAGKLGNAVVRNKIRRRLREIYRTNEGRFVTGHDVVLVARGRGLHVRYQRLERDVLDGAKRLGILRPPTETP